MLHPILPLVFRAEEEEAMRACRPGERACLRGPACYGWSLPRGCQLPRFRYWVRPSCIDCLTQQDLCVVCLRADTLAAWLDGLGSTPKTRVVQPYYVVIGPGEYAAEACIPIWDGGEISAARSLTTSVFDGISDAFVRFDPLRLRWEGLDLVQTDAEFTAFPQQIMLPSGLPDLFGELLHSGLLTPLAKTKAPGILRTLQDALWSRKPTPNLCVRS